MGRVKINGKIYETVLDEGGVERFPENSVLCHLLKTGSVDLNDLAIAYHQGELDPVDYMEFNMGLGYSVGGLNDFHAFFGDPSDDMFRGLGWEIEYLDEAA